MSKPTLEMLEKRLHALIGRVEGALHTIEGGTLPDLSDLDETVSTLCLDVENATPQIAKEVQPLMSKMIGTLDQMASALVDYQQKLQESKKP